MLSEDKIKKMIRLSDYENGHGKEDLHITAFSKVDYVRWQIIKTLVAVFISAILVVMLVLLYNFEYVLQNAFEIQWVKYAVIFVVALILLEIITITITVRISIKKYNESNRRVSEYKITLEELLKIYTEEAEEQVL